MNASQLSAIAVRLFGLQLLFSSLIEAEQTVNMMGNRAYGDALTLHDLLPTALMVAAALFLLLQTDLVVRFITRGNDSSPVPSLDAEQLTTAAFSLAGVVFLVSGLASLAALGVRLLVPHNPLRPDIPAEVLGSNAAFALVKCLLGLWLFAGSRQIVALAGRLRPSSSPPPEADA